MVTRTTQPLEHTPTQQPQQPNTIAALDGLAGELRAVYTDAFQLTFQAVQSGRRRFETPDGTDPIDPTYAADAAGCRAVNHHLPNIINRHLPGVVLVVGIDEPAVIDSQWLHQGHLITISWDYTLDFGDPNALSVAVDR